MDDSDETVDVNQVQRVLSTLQRVERWENMSIRVHVIGPTLYTVGGGVEDSPYFIGYIAISKKPQWPAGGMQFCPLQVH